MIPALALRGFGHGSGVVSPDGHVFIINIPKNASSYIFDWAGRQGWHAAVAQDLPDVQEMFVLLRDPIQRWISGMAQYINTYILSVHGPNGPIFSDQFITQHDYVMDAQRFIDQYTDVTERLVIDNAARFDDHVWPQAEIIQDVLPDTKRRYLRVDQALDAQISSLLGWQPLQGLDRNSGKRNANMNLLQDFFQQRLSSRPELVMRLQRHYQQDIDLIARVLP